MIATINTLESLSASVDNLRRTIQYKLKTHREASRLIPVVARMSGAGLVEFAIHPSASVRMMAIIRADRNDLPLFLTETDNDCKRELEKRIRETR